VTNVTLVSAGNGGTHHDNTPAEKHRVAPHAVTRGVVNSRENSNVTGGDGGASHAVMI